MALVDRRTGIEIIDRSECLRLLAADDFGRIGVLDGGHPLILPVNYAMDGDVVVFRTGEGTKLDAIRGPACFEIDGHDGEAHTGWSVVVRGRLEEVTQHQQDLYERLKDLASPWSTDAEKAHVLRIVPASIRGRRVQPPAPSA
jgi:nitroimidazol reductase NimA-like FMN-containing flavoprotein (pyridoxamine 5'-phosphate oxidase superfamily)